MDPEPRAARTLEQRLADLRARIDRAAAAAGRRPADVRLLLATKTRTAAEILRAIAAGFPLLGENRVQEVLAKAGELAAAPHELHFIGHLQANKVNAVLPHLHCLQTVDSAELARRLDARLDRLDRTLDVFVQVNVSGEASKSGVELAEVPALLAELARLPRLTVRGYMTIGLNSPDLSAVRAGYRALAEFRDRARADGLPGADQARELSMGMSGDFEAAIAEGATMVRVGSAVFGERPPVRK